MIHRTQSLRVINMLLGKAHWARLPALGNPVTVLWLSALSGFGDELAVDVHHLVDRRR